MRTALKRCAIGCFILAGSAFAPMTSAADVGVGLNAGTLGVGLDIGTSFTRTLVGRVGFNKLTISEDFTEDDIDYSTDLDLENFHALADWHIFRGGFRLTGGVIFNNNTFDGRAQVESGDEIGGAIAPSDGRLDLGVSYDDVAPYVGIGWGNIARGWSSFAFSVDAGLMYQGAASVDIDDNGTTGVSQDRLDEEAKEVEDELEEFDIFPVLSASLIYRF